MFIGPCIIAIVDKWKTNLMSLAILFHLLGSQHVSDINIPIFRSLRLCWWITTSVALFAVRCVLELLLRLVFGGVRFAGWSTASACKTNNEQRTENKTTDVVIHQHSRKLLKMDIFMSETCWAHNKRNKIASDVKLVFHSSTIAMMHGPKNIRWHSCVWLHTLSSFHTHNTDDTLPSQPSLHKHNILTVEGRMTRTNDSYSHVIKVCCWGSVFLLYQQFFITTNTR